MAKLLLSFKKQEKWLATSMRREQQSI